jgi:hypothetical protein
VSREPCRISQVGRTSWPRLRACWAAKLERSAWWQPASAASARRPWRHSLWPRAQPSCFRTAPLGSMAAGSCQNSVAWAGGSAGPSSESRHRRRHSHCSSERCRELQHGRVARACGAVQVERHELVADRGRLQAAPPGLVEQIGPAGDLAGDWHGQRALARRLLAAGLVLEDLELDHVARLVGLGRQRASDQRWSGPRARCVPEQSNGELFRPSTRAAPS